MNHPITNCIKNGIVTLPCANAKQQGFALIFCLFILFILSLLVFSSLEQQLLQAKLLASLQLRARIFQETESALQQASEALMVGNSNYDLNGFHIESATELLSEDSQGNKTYALDVTTISHLMTLHLGSEISTRRERVARTWWG